MKPRLFLSLAAASIALASPSCVPWVEPGPPPVPQGGSIVRNTDAPRPRDEANPEEQEARAERRRHRNDPPPENTDGGGTGAVAGGGENTTTEPNPEPAPPKTPRKENLPYGIKIPNKPGEVLSPYTHERVDVSAVHSGGKASDPTAPGKFFRVP